MDRRCYSNSASALISLKVSSPKNPGQQVPPFASRVFERAGMLYSVVWACVRRDVGKEVRRVGYRTRGGGGLG